MAIALAAGTLGEVPPINRTSVFRTSELGTPCSPSDALSLASIGAIIAPAAPGVRPAAQARGIEAAPLATRLRSPTPRVTSGPFPTLSIRKASRVGIFVNTLVFILAPDAVRLGAIPTRRVFNTRTSASVQRQALSLSLD